MTVTEFRVSVPLRVALSGLTTREATLIEGPAGWGEFSPLPGYPCDPVRCRRAAEEAAGEPWPEPLRDKVPVNALVPAVPPDEAFRRAQEAAAAKIRTVKVKVGAAPAPTTGGTAPAGRRTDLDRVAAVRAALGPKGKIRLDANGAWTVEDAVEIIRRLSRYDLELVEQPVASLEDLARLRRKVNVPLAADESVRTLDDARRLASLEAADALVVKVQPLGGVRAALEVIQAAGVPAIVTSMYETSIGLAAGVALAACLPELPYACGLGTGTLLAGDVVADPLVPVYGKIALRRTVPDPVLLDRYRVES